MSEIEKRSNKSYKELQQRFDREKQLGVIQEKMVLKRVLKKGEREKPDTGLQGQAGEMRESITNQ